MERALDDAVGGRDPEKVTWLGLGHNTVKFQGERFLEIAGLQHFAGLVSLDLSGHAISSLENLKYLRTLEELDISKNRLKRLEGVGRLRNLRILHAQGNGIDHIPKQIGLLLDLKHLDLSENRLATLNDMNHLHGCRSLCRLGLKKNPICAVQNLREVVLACCDNLIYLDGAEIHVRSRKGDDIIRCIGEEPETDSVSKDDSVSLERQNYVRILRENEELRSELEATSQLLARKTSEWAVSEEQVSQLKQQLAFLRIDSSSTANTNDYSPPSQTLRSVYLTQESIAIDSATNDQDLGQESFSQISLLDESSFLMPDGSKSDNTHSSQREVGLEKTLKEIESKIQDNATRTTERLQVLAADYKGAKKALETLQSQAEFAVATFNRTKLECEAADKRVSSRSEPPIAANRKEHYPSKLQVEKQQELADLSMLVGKLRDLRSVLKAKLEIAQDLLVFRTERLVIDEENEDSFRIDAKQEKIDRLEAQFSRLSTNATALLSEVSFSVSANARLRDFLPDLSVLDIEVDDSYNLDISLVSQASSSFDGAITRLSEQAIRVKEQDTHVKDCLDSCLNRITHVEAALELVRAQDPIVVDKESTSSAEPSHELQAKLLHVSVEQEADIVAKLRDEIKVAQFRLREIQISILKLKSESWRTEALLRSQQHSIFSKLLDSKSATIQACNRTIIRLRDTETPLPSAVPLSLNSTIVTSLERLDLSPRGTRSSPSNRSELLLSPRPQHEAELFMETETVQLMNASEQKARLYRKQVYDEIVDSEQKYTESVVHLVNVYLLPMRRKCLLAPRDLQVICGNYQDIANIHETIVQSISGQKDAQAVLSALHKNLGNFEMYQRCCANLTSAISMVNTRRKEVPAFATFLRAAFDSEPKEEDIITFLLYPLRRMLQYERLFSRLLTLNTSNTSSAVRNKVALLASSLGDLLQTISTDEKKILEQAATIEEIQRLWPCHSALGKLEKRWLSEARLYCEHRKLLASAQTVQATIVFPDQKAITFKKAMCMVFSDFVVIAAFPSKWRATFDGEQPKLRACCLLRAKDGLASSQPFSVPNNSSFSDPFLIGLRLTAKGMGGGISTERLQGEGRNSSGEPNHSILQEGNVIEAILQFHDRKDAEVLHYSIEDQARSRQVRQPSPKNKDLLVKGISGISPQGKLSEACSSNVNSKEDGDDLSYVPKYPGTDMTKRREIAKQLREARNTWQPPELEHVESKLAKERIKKRDGLPLASVAVWVDDAFELRVPTRTILPENEYELPQARRELMITPIKTTPTPLSPTGESRSRISLKMQDQLGFGSSAKLERNKGIRARKLKSPRKGGIGSPRASGFFREDDVVYFDPTSPYFMTSSEANVEPAKPNLSIFKSPAKKIPQVGEGVGFQSKRLIGIGSDPSEYIKEANRAESKYYNNL